MFTRLHGKSSERNKVLKLPPTFAETYIGLRAHLGDGVFLLDNGDLGKVFKVSGISDESLTEDELYSAFLPLTKLILGVIKGLPSYKNDASTVVQLFCSQRLAKCPSENAQAELQSAAYELIEREKKHLFATGLIQRSFFLTIRWTPANQSSIYSNLKAAIRQAIKADAASSIYIQNLQSSKDYFTKELSTKALEAGFTLNPVSTEDLISYFNSILNFGESVEYTLGDEELLPLWENIVNPEVNGSPIGFDGKDKNIRIFTFSELPSTFALGRLRQFVDALPMKSWDMVWTLSHGSKDAGAEHTIKKMFYSQGPSHRKKYEDLLSFEEGVSTSNPSVKMSFKLLAYNVTDDVKSRIFSTSIDYIGVPIILESQIAPHLIASALPLNASKEDHNVLGRVRNVLLDRALCFAPFYTSSSYNPGMRWWISRSGEPIKIDLFAGGGNNHVCVLGNSESGKSCLLAQFNLEFLARFPSGVIRIIDRKTSYQKLCDIFDGKIITFNEQFLRENPYSPFAYESWDDDDLQNTIVFIQNAIFQLNPEAQVTGLHTEIITEAIKLAVNDHEKNKLHRDSEEVDPHPTWIDIKKKLPTAAQNKGSNQSLVFEALEDIRRWTVSFDQTGQFGFLFCYHEKLDARSENARILVYDLDGIVDPRLQILASQLAFLSVTRSLKKIPRKERKLIVFEELGVLVQGDSPQAGDLATRFIRNVVKTARKIGAQAIGISNELSDFTKSEAGKTFWKVAPQKLFLPLSQSGRQELREELNKEISPADIDIATDLIIKKGFYSQAYLMTQNLNFRGSFLIPLSPLMNALVTTNNKEEDLYREFRKNGLSAFEAIECMAQKHPYGANL